MVCGRNYPPADGPSRRSTLWEASIVDLRGGGDTHSVLNVETQLKSCENFLVWISLLLLNLTWVTTQTKVWES